MQLRKYHGLGNDYLVLETGEALGPALVRRICDRNRGPGADGILEFQGSKDGVPTVRIWNPDGSQAEKSGNGLRIFARWWVEQRGGDRRHQIAVGGARVQAHVPLAGPITMEMGLARFGHPYPPVGGPMRDTPTEVCGHTLRLSTVDVGNPHCVAWFGADTDLDALPWRAWGAALERDRRFPERSNVQFAAPRGPGRVDARIWERGAGETAASGSSACAVAFCGARDHGLGPAVAVRMPGGTLRVQVDADDQLVLEGPVEEVCVSVLNPNWLEP